MPGKIAHKAGTAHGGFVRVVYRYPDNTTRTVLKDPKTGETTLESEGTAQLDGSGNPTATWWNPA